MQDEDGRALLDVSMSSPVSGQVRRTAPNDRWHVVSSASNRPPHKVVHLYRGLLFNLTAKTEPTDLPLTIGVRIVAPNGLQHQEARTSPTASSEFTVCPSTLPEYRHRVPYRVFTGRVPMH